jgi:hypothetical protein
MPRLDGFSFPTAAPTRDEILAAIADETLISAWRLNGLSTALDGNAVASFSPDLVGLANRIRSIPIDA